MQYTEVEITILQLPKLLISLRKAIEVGGAGSSEVADETKDGHSFPFVANNTGRLMTTIAGVPVIPSDVTRMVLTPQDGDVFVTFDGLADMNNPFAVYRYPEGIPQRIGKYDIARLKIVRATGEPDVNVLGEYKTKVVTP